jgi:conjugal transfer pilus assembly protein TraW
MKKMWSASRNLFFSFLLFFTLSPALAAGQAPPVITPGRLSAGILEDAMKAQSTFLKPSSNAEFTKILSRSRSVSNLPPTQDPGNFTLKDYYRDSGRMTLTCRSSRPDKGDALYYFFSFSMPGNRIKEVMTEAARTGAVMVLRGLYGDTIQATAQMLAGIYGKQGYPVEIDPTLFDDYNIKTVPTILRKKEGKGVWRIEGDVPIKYALDKFAAASPGDIGVLGPTYPIAETNMLSLIYARLRRVDWQGKAQEMAGKMFRFKGFDIPTATSPKTYYVDPSVVLSQDIRDHTGKVIFPAGAAVNPADYVPLTGSYIVINGLKPAQVRLALRGRYRKIMLTKGDLRALIKKYGVPFYVATEAVVERFSISAVPSVISREGRLIKVEQIVPAKD